MTEASLTQRALKGGTGIVLFCATAGVAAAGTIRDDVADAQYTALAADPRYAPIGMLSWNSGGSGYIGSGTLISSSWVLTAAHCVDDAAATNVRFKLGNSTYSASKWFAHGSWTDSLSNGWDIGLVKLPAPVTDVIPAARFTGASEMGLVGTSVGFGKTGTGVTGDTLAAGTKRAGQNTLDVAGSRIGYSNRIALADFDNPAGNKNQSWSPSATPLAMEYSIAPGDSGGGTFVEVQGATRLAGVHSFGLAYDGTVNSSYGDVFGVTRVNQFNEWIDDMISVQWARSTGGTLGAGANWVGGVAPVWTDVVGFRTSGVYTVNVTAPAANDRLLARGGQVTLDLGGNTYSLTSTSAEGSLVVGKYGGNNAAVTAVNGTLSTRDVVIGELGGSYGTLVAGAGAVVDVNGSAYVGGHALGGGGSGTLVVEDGAAMTVAGTLQAHVGGTINYDGGSLAAGRVAIAGGGKLLVSAGGDKVLRTRGVDIAGTGRIDLSDNDMVIDYDGTSPAEAIRQYLIAGRAGGTWTGNGITSSAAATEADGATTLGWADNASLGLTLFSGVAIDPTSVLVKYTWYGDANLDGRISIDDYSLLDRGIARGLDGWVNGDFNFDGKIDKADYLLIDKGFALQTGSLSPEVLMARTLSFGDAYVAQLISSVPEPTAVASASVVAGAALLRRRRR